MMIVLLVIGGLFVASRLKTNGGSNVPLFTPKTPYVPWSAPSPSNAGSEGSGETSPIMAVMLKLRQGFSAPAPYVPLSGPGGATVLPAASGAPSGTAQNTLQASAPGTVPVYPMREDLANAADPAYWWLMPSIDVAIMSEDVNGAMLKAGSELDLSPAMVEASIGANWRT